MLHIKKLGILPEILTLMNSARRKVQLRNLSTRWQEVSDTGLTSASGIVIFNSHIFNLQKTFVVVLNCDIYIQTENGF